MTSATEETDLRTGHTLWEASSGLGLDYAPLEGSVVTDIAIVGAGITGAFMAHALSASTEAFKREWGYPPSITVLDRRRPLSGSTLASTALLQWEIDLPLVHLAKKIGHANASRAYRRCFQALSDLSHLIKAENIRCAFEERSTLYLAGDQYGARALAKEAEERARLDLPSTFLNARELAEQFGIKRTGAIFSLKSASANPGQLAAGLMRRALANGITLYSPVEVVDVLADPSGVSLKMDNGHVVRAKKVVFCTGYELPEMVSIPKADILSTWAIASDKSATMPAWMKDTMVWEASDPYLYFRATPDGRIVLGGEDADDPLAHTQKSLLQNKAKTLQNKLKSLIPEIEFQTEYKWAGAFGNSTTGLPFIAPARSMDNVWAVAGLGGNGITYSVIASQIVKASFCGKTDPDADLYL